MVSTPDSADDQALVAAARADPARFLELYDRHFHRVYAFVLRRAGSRREAEDVTAEVFHRALAHLDKYEWRGIPFAAWLYRIAAHELSDRWQEAARFAAAEPPDSGSDSQLEQRIAVFQLVDRLPDDQRCVIELRFGEGRSIREAAQALGRSEGAIKQLQRRALENLRRGLEHQHG